MSPLSPVLVFGGIYPVGTANQDGISAHACDFGRANGRVIYPNAMAYIADKRLRNKSAGTTLLYAGLLDALYRSPSMGGATLR